MRVLFANLNIINCKNFITKVHLRWCYSLIYARGQEKGRHTGDFDSRSQRFRHQRLLQDLHGRPCQGDRNPRQRTDKRFGTKEEVLISGFRWGQKQMEEELRPIISGGLDAHIALMFDAIMKGLAPFGPEIHLALIYQATQDKVLMEIIRRSSRNVNFAVKAYLAQMVALAIMESVDEVEKVNEEMVSSFVQYLAQTLQGKKIEAIKKQWVAHVRTMLKPSAKTTVPPI